MKLLQVDLEAYRRSRRRATRFTLIFFTLLVTAWPLINAEILGTDNPVMEDVHFKAWDVHIVVDETGRQVARETVVVDFAQPHSYVRAVPELSAADPEVRYFSRSLGAKIDGEPVDVDSKRTGRGHYFIMGEDLVGEHTIEFSFEVENAVTYYKGKPQFRARLLPRYSLSQVENFTAVVEAPGMVTDNVVCWTTDFDKPRNEEDECAYEELTPTRAVIAIDKPAYLRPVRFVAELTGEGYEEDRLPWPGYWDSVLGQHLWTPFLALALALGLPFAARRPLARLSDRAVVGGALGLALAYGAAHGLILGFMPSIGLLLLGGILWGAIPAYLRRTEASRLVTPEAAAALQATQGEKKGKMPVAEPDSSA